VTATLQQLHWLPVELRVQYKLCILMHTIHYYRCPSYLADTVSTVADQSLRPGLRSAQTARYFIPRCGTFGEHAFSYSGPAAWNQLPHHLHNISNSATFRKHLKAYHCRALWQYFRSQRWITGEPSISCQNAPDCTKLHLKFQNFPGVTPPDPHPW